MQEGGPEVSTRKPRQEFTKATKLAAWDRCGECCEECGAKLRPGKFRFDHDIPDALGGDNSLENCVVRCLACDKPKTAKDQTNIAKAKRVEEKHLGIHESRYPPMPGTKRSRFKIGFDGVLRDRETGEPIGA